MVSLSSDQVVGSFRVIRQIGQGGMGAVYEAVHIVLGHRVALKLLTCDSKADGKLILRFFNEARAASQIHHPGIVKVHDIGQLDEHTPWMALEYLEGESFSTRLDTVFRQTRRAMAAEDCLWIIGEVAAALDAAHSKGIIHRDLKPANIMIVPDSATLVGERAKVLDFGIAKLAHEGTLTQSGAVMGTSVYMALEQFKSAADVDGKADVFSLGVILYQSLSGRLPHGGDTPYAVMGARLLDPIVPIGQLAPGLEPEVARLTMAMLEREPGDRPSMRDIELTVRRLRGLPPPRQSGFHAATPGSAGASQPVPPALPGSDDSISATADAPITLSPSMQLGAPTPSGDRAAGEVSPPELAVPQSLSSMPSVPVRAIPIQSSASSATVAALPAPLPAAALSSPSAPTQRESLSRMARAVLLGLGALSLLFTVIIWRWPRQAQPLQNPPSQPPPTRHEVEPTARSSPGPAPSVAAPPSPQVGSPPPSLVSPGADTPRPASEKAPGKSAEKIAERTPENKARQKTCEPQPPSLACIGSPRMPMSRAQTEPILAALQDSGIKLCAGDRLQIIGLPRAPQIGSAPSAVRKAAQSLLIPALRGALPEGPFPAEVVVQCPAR